MVAFVIASAVLMTFSCGEFFSFLQLVSFEKGHARPTGFGLPPLNFERRTHDLHSCSTSFERLNAIKRAI